MQMKDLKDKVVVVTGGAGGIGSATARVFREAGARVVIVGLDMNKAGMLARELEASALELDITDSAAVDTVVARVVADHGGIDVWVSIRSSEGHRY